MQTIMRAIIWLVIIGGVLYAAKHGTQVGHALAGAANAAMDVGEGIAKGLISFLNDL